MPTKYNIFGSIGASNAFYSSKRRLMEQYTLAFQQWLKHHQFPADQKITDEFQQFSHQQWQSHTAEVQEHPRLNHKFVKHVSHDT